MPRALKLDQTRLLLGDLRVRVSQFWSWWSRELAGLVPKKFSAYWNGPRRTISVLMRRDGPLGVEKEGVELGQFPGFPTLPLPEPLATELHLSDAVEVLLAADSTLRRTFELPLAAERELAAAIHFEIDRQTPFLPENVQHRFRILDRNFVKKTLRVELAVVPNATIQQISALEAALQIHVASVHLAGDEHAPPFEFGRRRRLRIADWKAEPWKPIFAAAAVLFIIGLPLLQWHVHSVADELATEVKTRRSASTKANELRIEVDKLTKVQAFLPRKLRSPRALPVLAAVTKALPDDVWTFDLDLDPTQLRIEGLASSVPLVLQRLQQADLFDQPKLNSSVARTDASGQDRFDIVARFKEPLL